MAGAGVEPALNLYPAEREGLALPGYQKSKSYESRITAILCGEGESNPSTRFTDKRPDLPLAGPSLLSAGAGLSRLSSKPIINRVKGASLRLCGKEGTRTLYCT